MSENSIQDSQDKILEASASLKKSKIYLILYVSACVVWTCIVLGFCIHEYIERLRVDIRNEIIIEMNKAFAERDKIISDNTVVANKNVNNIWRWIGKNVKVQAENTKIFHSRISEMRKELNEHIDVYNENMETIDQDFEALERKINTIYEIRSDLEEVRQGLSSTADNAVENTIALSKMDKNIKDLDKYRKWLESKYFGILQMPER